MKIIVGMDDTQEKTGRFQDRRGDRLQKKIAKMFLKTESQKAATLIRMREFLGDFTRSFPHAVLRCQPSACSMQFGCLLDMTVAESSRRLHASGDGKSGDGIE